jgi:hypothetical protein
MTAGEVATEVDDLATMHVAAADDQIGLDLLSTGDPPPQSQWEGAPVS